MNEPPEQRRKGRSALFAGYHVHDAATRAVIGTLLDLSLSGFRLGSPRPVAVGERQRLFIPLPKAYKLGDKLELEAECRWLRAELDAPGFHSGFELSSECAAAVQETLSKLLRRIQ